jgi:isocitrate/isopropylmalate dehydrogenase
MHIVVLPGDGIGAEITASTLAVLQVVDQGLAPGLAFERYAIGFASLKSACPSLGEHEGMHLLIVKWAPRRRR